MYVPFGWVVGSDVDAANERAVMATCVWVGININDVYTSGVLLKCCERFEARARQPTE